MTLEQWFLAAQSNDVDFIKQHLEQFCGKRDKLFGDKTALMYAAQNNHLDAARLLYLREQGLQNQSGSTALHFAAARGHSKIIQLLASVERDIKNDKGKTPRDVAQEKNYGDELLSIFDSAPP